MSSFRDRASYYHPNRILKLQSGQVFRLQIIEEFTVIFRVRSALQNPGVDKARGNRAENWKLDANVEQAIIYWKFVKIARNIYIITECIVSSFW